MLHTSSGMLAGGVAVCPDDSSSANLLILSGFSDDVVVNDAVIQLNCSSCSRFTQKNKSKTPQSTQTDFLQRTCTSKYALFLQRKVSGTALNQQSCLYPELEVFASTRERSRISTWSLEADLRATEREAELTAEAISDLPATLLSTRTNLNGLTDGDPSACRQYG